MNIRRAMVTAQAMHKSIIEQTYDDTCTVSIQENIKDPVTKITSKVSIMLLQEIPCKLVIESSSPVIVSNEATKPVQNVRLLLDPEVEIPVGSKISVTNQGRTQEYKRSGKPILFATHQEVELELFQEWS